MQILKISNKTHINLVPKKSDISQKYLFLHIYCKSQNLLKKICLRVWWTRWFKVLFSNSNISYSHLSFEDSAMSMQSRVPESGPVFILFSLSLWAVLIATWVSLLVYSFSDANDTYLGPILCWLREKDFQCR